MFLKTEVIEEAVGEGSTIFEVSPLFPCAVKCCLKRKRDSVEKQMENSHIVHSSWNPLTEFSV